MKKYDDFKFNENSKDKGFNKKSKLANKVLLNLSVGIFSDELFEYVYKILFKSFELKTKKDKDEMLKQFNAIWDKYSVFSDKFLNQIKGDFIDFLYN